MNAGRRKRKKRSLAQAGNALGAVLSGPAGRLLVATVLLGMLVAGAVYAWRRCGGQIVTQPEYMLQPENIQITPSPAWIPERKFKKEVVEQGHLRGLSILDRDLTVKVAEAFSRHSWVRTVRRVSKQFPARVVVDLEYRKPVARVEVVMNGRPGLLPVDVEGVLLPPDDFRIPPPDFAGTAEEFAAEQARSFLRISVPNAVPTGAAGTAWGDRRIVAAAHLAAFLGDRWKSLGLYRIRLYRSNEAGNSEPIYELATRKGVCAIWGRAPDPSDPADVARAAEKLAKLQAHLRAHGARESASQAAAIDLREPATARTPSAESLERF